MNAPSFRTAVAGAVLAIFLLIGSVGMQLTMQGRMSSGMTDCPFMMMSMGQPGVLCEMGIAEHLSTWQRTFSAPLPVGMDMLLIFIGFCLIGIFYSLKGFTRQTPFSFLSRYRWFMRGPWRSHGFDFLIRIFSQGILHPKRHNI